MTKRKIIRHLCFWLALYIGGNVFLVYFVTMLNPSQLVIHVTDAQTNIAISNARLIDHHSVVERAGTDATGVLHYETSVQDQGWWVFPRMGVTANLSGRKYKLAADQYQTKTIIIPKYTGQSFHLEVSLDPADTKENRP